jgi:hypothetical protein
MPAHRTTWSLRDWVLLAFGVVGLLSLLVATYLWGLSTGSQQTASASSPTSSSSSPSSSAPLATTGVLPTGDIDVAADTETESPGMNPKFAPPDGPDPDDPMFGVDVVALAAEFRTHGVDTHPDQYPLLLAMTNRHIARGDDDLDAWDREITEDTRELYPDLRKGLVIDITRCWAEYVERVIARNAGKAAPPDSDDHKVRVDNRAEQPRITQSPIVTPTS